MKSKLLIYLFIAATIPLGFWAVSTLQFETNINAYNLASDEDIAHFQSFTAKLGQRKSAESIIILEKKSGWKTFEDFQLLAAITAFWQAQPEIVKASSITNLPYPKQGFFRAQSEPFLHLEDRQRFQKRMDQLDRYPDIVSKFISPDHQYTLVFLSAPQGISQQSAQRLEQSSTFQQDLEVHYLQYDLIQDELQKTLKRDTIVLAAISLGLILIGFYFFTHSLRGLGLIGVMVLFNIAMTFIVMYALSMRYTLHMITIPCIITVLSFTDIMHLLYHQQQEYASSRTDRELQAKLLAAVRIPLFLTSLTNIVGFLVFLLFAQNIHLFNFSLASIIGVTIAYLSSRFLVIRLLDRNTIFIKRADFSNLYRVHNSTAEWFWRKKNYLRPAFIAAFVVLAMHVTSTLTIDGSEQEYSLSHSALTRGTQLLQNNFFGAKQAEVFITLQEGTIWDKPLLDQLEQVEAEITATFQPLFINSPGVVVKRFHRYLRNGNPAAYTIPARTDSTYIARLHQHQGQLGGEGIVDSTATKARIVFGFGNLRLPEARKRYQHLRTLLQQYNSDAVHYQLSGLQYLSDEATHAFSLKIVMGLVFSILVGSILVWLFMHSFRKSIGVLLVNLFPLFFALALMLALGLSITPLTLFFLSILLGICVDDSIYLITQDRQGTTALHVVPVFITSLVLSLGFLSLAFSSFGWIKPFAWIFLVGITLAYLLDLFVLQLFLNRKAIFGNDG